MLSSQEKQIIDAGISAGKSKEEIRRAILNYKTGVQPKRQPTQPSEPGGFSRLGASLKETARKRLTAISDIERSDAPRPKKIVTGLAQIAGGITEAVVKTGMAGVSAVIPDEVEEEAKKSLDVLSKTSFGKKVLRTIQGGEATYAEVKKTNPEAFELLESVVDISALYPFAKAGVGAVKKGKELAQVGFRGVSGGIDGITTGAAAAGDVVAQNARNLKTRTQKYLGGKAVSPQLEVSTQRLQQPFLSGTKRMDSPVKMYDDYLKQSKSSITDIKADPPISQIGSEMGDAFRSVVQTRRAIGAKMGSELEKVKNIKVNTLPVTDQFIQTLKTNGLVYDRVKKSIISTTRQTKMGEADRALLQTYARELQKLGTKPTIGDIDSFLSRLNQDIKIYKSANNITGVTNAERIILESMRGLRNYLSKTPGLKSYAEARALYSNYSKFIEEGEGFLGKVTQSGDFAKDASLAKSSVQSILNNGKKDWMIRLEELTGQDFLDRTVLALQAMKDAGDFRGLSLLQTFSSSVPGSKNAISQKIIDYALSKGLEKFGGTTEEQTRAFLNSLTSQK